MFLWCWDIKAWAKRWSHHLPQTRRTAWNKTRNQVPHVTNHQTPCKLHYSLFRAFGMLHHQGTCSAHNSQVLNFLIPFSRWYNFCLVLSWHPWIALLLVNSLSWEVTTIHNSSETKWVWILPTPTDSPILQHSIRTSTTWNSGRSHKLKVAS